MNELTEYFLRNAELSRRGMKLRALQGGHTGRIPAGYLGVHEGYKRKVVPDPARAPLVRRAFRMAAGGAPLRRIAVELGMGPSSLWKVLTNPLYAGFVRYGGELIRGRHEAIVGRGEFALVQRQLAKRRKRPPRG